MADTEKTGKKKSKKAAKTAAAEAPATGEYASVTDSVNDSIAAFRGSGLFDDAPEASAESDSGAEALAEAAEINVSAAEEVSATEPAEQIEWSMGDEEMAMEELGEPKEHEVFETAAEETEENDEATEEDGLSDTESAIADAELGPAEFIDEDQAVSIIEAMLFASNRPVGMGTLKQIFKGSNIRSKDIKRILEDLASDYAGARRGVTLEEVNGGYQLRTKVDNAEFLRRLNKSRPFRLSGPALETLSIVAYKQPITKHEVDEIRGVESGHLIRALMERGIVNFQGKSELPGKPMMYGTTRKFLEIFGLRNIKELPTLSEIDELLPEGIGDEEEVEKPKLADLTDSMSTAIGSSYSEGEDELMKINESLAAVDTTSEFFEQEKIRQREKRDAERAANIREALAVGEAVDKKDERWLARYEAKLNAPAAAEAAPVDGANVEGAELAENATEGVEAAAITDEDAEFAEDVENLTETLQTDNRTNEDDDLEEGEDLLGSDSDWDELANEPMGDDEIES